MFRIFICEWLCTANRLSTVVQLFGAHPLFDRTIVYIFFGRAECSWSWWRQQPWHRRRAENEMKLKKRKCERAIQRDTITWIRLTRISRVFSNWFTWLVTIPWEQLPHRTHAHSQFPPHRSAGPASISVIISYYYMVVAWEVCVESASTGDGCRSGWCETRNAKVRSHCCERCECVRKGVCDGPCS